MSKSRSFAESSIGKKLFMALTGLFLCTFLVAHLAGNLQLFLPADQAMLQFNAYSHFMTSNPVIKIASYLTYFSILFHAVQGVRLAYTNKTHRPVKYQKYDGGASSTWSSRNMGILGTLIFVFIVIHMRSFWYEMHWGEVGLDSAGNKDLYTLTTVAFEQLWYVILYVVCMLALAYHLYHGIQSGFQTLGLSHPKYTPIIQKAGAVFSIAVPALFAAIPVYLYFT